MELTIEGENEVIEAYTHKDFYSVLVDEFGPGGLVTIMGYATLYGLTGKKTTIEAREALVKLGLSEVGVYKMYRAFRRLRRRLLKEQGYTMQEQKGGPGMNDGVPPVVAKFRDLTSIPA